MTKKGKGARPTETPPTFNNASNSSMVFVATRSAMFVNSNISNSKLLSTFLKDIQNTSFFFFREKVIVPDSKPYISLIGVENRTSETIITWNDKASDEEKDGRGRGRELGTSRSASVAIESDFFCATGITIEVQIIPGYRFGL